MSNKGLLFVFFITVCGISINYAFILEGKQVDPAWLQEQNTYSFFATIPKSDPICGNFGTYEPSCVYCVGSACGKIPVRDDELNIHYETDPATCYNRFLVLTTPNYNGECPSWVSKQTMITASDYP